MITINPATLDDDALWSFADLRQLCKQLHLGARGKRVELVDRLQTWHKLRVHDRAALALTETHADADPSLESWIPLNVEGSNFSILHQNITARDSLGSPESKSSEPMDHRVPASPSRRRSGVSKLAPEPVMATPPRRSRRQSLGSGAATAADRDADLTALPLTPGASAKKRSLLGFNSTEKNLVSPTLLKPLTTTTGNDTTPGKSILRCAGVMSPRVSQQQSSACKIHFSPFNGTKVIPNRSAVSGILSPDTGILEPSSDSGSDESDEDWDENYVDAVARYNAERNTQLADDSDNDGELWERID